MKSLGMILRNAKMTGVDKNFELREFLRVQRNQPRTPSMPQQSGGG